MFKYGSKLMSSKVFFVPLNDNDSLETIAKSAVNLFDKAGFASMIKASSLVAIKQHMGEGQNTTHISPIITKAIVEKVKSLKANPFVTDSNTLYRGRRTNAVDHLLLAYEHGFSLEKLGAPVIIADGLIGIEQVPVEINKKHFKEVFVSAAGYHAHSIIALTHVTGHPLSGLGGTIKNFAMGLASRSGKINQHCSVRPKVKESDCVACETCAEWCPADAITVDKYAVIDEDKCIGCGECMAICPSNVIEAPWGESSENMQEKMAEYTLGIVKNKEDRVACISFITNVTKGCDCYGTVQNKEIPDVGIIASSDPIALDTATADIIIKRLGKDTFKEFYPNVDYRIQLKHGQAIGLGSMDYELIEI
jgi:uncharacterized Fe-S center protein